MLSSYAFSQNTLPLFPCYGGQISASGCPAVAGVPSTFNPLIENDDYYDVYVESVCINQKDSWWKNKLVHVEVTIKAGAVSKLVPVYAQRTGNQCHIGVANYPLLTSVPANGNALTLASHVYRSDDQDGMRKVLGFLTDQQKNTTLNTYAAAAVPYLTAVGDVANQVYSSFATHSEDYQDFKDMVLSPQAVIPSRFDLKDGFIAVYAGNDNPKDADVYIDSSDELRWNNGTRVEDGSTWIVFRIQKRHHRSDYPLRPWFMDWQQLARQVKTRQVDADAVKKRIAIDNTLLNADLDYTSGDKDYYSDIFLKSQAQMLIYLNDANASVASYDKAIKDALVTPDVVGLNSQGQTITATNGTTPVVGRASLLDRVNPQMLLQVISPEKFLINIQKLNQEKTPR